MLGGAKALGLRDRPGIALLPELVRAGFRFSALEALQQRYRITQVQMEYLLNISARTFARRKVERILTKSESDWLYRVARVAVRAEDVLGSAQATERWLKESLPTLGGATPLSSLDTDEGAQQVTELLGRIEHGVYS